MRAPHSNPLFIKSFGIDILRVAGNVELVTPPWVIISMLQES
jgi:hypothetical protein